jgi:hypothetical protein
MICPRTKFHMSDSNDSLYIAVKPKDTEYFLTACVLLFHYLQNIF